jgi:long-chain acyl-CoA synthetase
MSQPRVNPAGTRTIGSIWLAAADWAPDRPAYLEERDGSWIEVSRAEAARRIDALANGLLSLGVRKGDAFAILGATGLEWCLFDFALGLIGAVGAPIYTSSSARDCAYVIDHSESVGVLVDDGEQLAKVEEMRPQLPRLRNVLTFADLPDLEAQGREYADEHPQALDEAAAEVGEEDLFTLMYTSGTTGPPKACMIRHRNCYEMVSAVDELPGLLEDGDVMLLYLPLAHTFGRLMHLAAPRARYTLAFCADPLQVPAALLAVRPTVFPSVPRAYEKVHTAVLARLGEAHGARALIGRWALRVGRRVSALRQAREPVPTRLAFSHRLADKLVFSKVKERFGGRLRVALSGGAPLSPEIIQFFHALDILILEGYGLSECTTACSVNRPDHYKFGTVGPALPGFEVRLAEDGELLLRSETVFAGYFEDEEATRAALDEEGWLQTGDIGEIDEEGFVTITDRKKDILVTAGGKNVAPQNLENELKASRYVSQALVVGDRRPYIAALITLDDDEIESLRSEGEADLQALVQRLVDEVNSQHSPFEQIKRFAILPRDFSASEGEITPTLKLKRRVVEERFADEIERLYG